MLRARSPKRKVGGPYIIVYKVWDEEEGYGWSICALDYDGDPRLGIRWWGLPEPNGNLPGFPGPKHQPKWLILPEEISEGVLTSLPIHPKVLHAIRRFLAGAADGADLEKLSEQ